MKGGLGEVLPPELRATIERAAVEPPETVAIEWRGASAAHRLRRVIAAAAAPVVPPADRHEPAAAPLAEAPPEVPPEVPRLADPAAVVRRRISGAGDVNTPPRPGAPTPLPRSEAPTPFARPEAQAVGTLVHRLLERDPDLGHRDLDRLRLLARRLLRQDDRRGTRDPGAVADAAAALAAAMAEDAALAARLRAGRRWHEVPVAFREGNVVWRGALDVLVDADDARADVVEFKTGRPGPGHQEQLRLYVEAVRALRPAAAVTGRLAYLRASREDDDVG
jgi:hypothetical protein